MAFGINSQVMAHNYKRRCKENEEEEGGWRKCIGIGTAAAAVGGGQENEKFKREREKETFLSFCL